MQLLHEKTIFLLLKKRTIHNLIFQDHHSIRKHHMYFLNRFVAKKCTIFLTLRKKKQLHKDEIIKISLKKYLLIITHCHKKQQITFFSV